MAGGNQKEAGGIVHPIGRRKFLLIGGAGAAALASSAGIAAAIKAGLPGDPASPRSQAPVGLDPSTGRNDGAVPAKQVVRYLALAGTDGWASMPEAGNPAVGRALGAADIDPYFPDPYADPANRTTYVFSFRNVTDLSQDQVAAQKGRTQLCAPLFFSTVGEEIWVTLTNLGLHLRPDLVDSHTLHWHGFRNAIPFYDGVPESSISVPIGRAFTYVYRPQDAGTYMYHCHFEDVEHVTMGMHGIVFVKPDVNDRVNLGPVGSATPSSTLGRQKAYGTKDGDAAGESVYDREFAIMLSEIDARAHFNDAHIQATDWTDFHADFWTFNGRAYPDTLLPNSVRDANGDLHAQKQNGWETVNGQQKPKLETILDDAGEGRLASNPLSSLVQCAPGDRVLIRFANLGFLNHSIVFPGLEVDVLGRDARFVPDSAQRTNTDTIQIGPGESRDVFIDIPALPALVDEVMYPFYDRGMSHYTGSADGSNAWVGGQRSAIQVRRNLAAQEKPNGWGGEVVWHGEQPLVATHVVTITATLRRQSTGNRRDRGTFLSGSVTIDAHPAATLTDLWYINSSTMPAADPTVGNWRSITVDANNAFTDVRVSQQSSGGTYWLLAKDSAGVFSLVTQAV